MSRLDPNPAGYVTPGSVIQICGLDPDRKKYFRSGHRLRRISDRICIFWYFTDWFHPVFLFFFRQVHRGDRVLCHGDSITREEKIIGLVCWLSLQCMHIQNSCVYCTRQQPSFSTRLLLTCRLFQTSKWVVGPRDAIAIARTSPTPSRGSTGTVWKFLYKLGGYPIRFGSLLTIPPDRDACLRAQHYYLNGSWSLTHQLRAALRIWDVCPGSWFVNPGSKTKEKGWKKSCWPTFFLQPQIS
jgi:hypothetical protein